MPKHNPLSLTLFANFFLLFAVAATTAATTPQDEVFRSSCAEARYPALCVKTLSKYAGSNTKPLDLAQAATKASLGQARALSIYLKTTVQTQATSTRQRAALSDCMAQISDSVTQLDRTLSELQHLQVKSFQWQMSNAQTWASTVMSNGGSCVRSFRNSDADAKLKLDMNRRVTTVTMLTSNALYLITRLSEGTSRNHRSNSHP